MSDKTLKVLFIDDEPQALEQAEVFFEKESDIFEIVTTTSPEKGLEMLSKEDFDAVVCDYMMPKMDGIDLLTALRDGGSDIPFIMLTGRGEEVVAMEALNIGADRYLRKGTEKSPMNLYKFIARTILHEVETSRSEEGLQRSEERYRSLFENRESPMIVVRNDDYTISLANESFEDLSGYSKGEIEGKKSLEEFVADEDVKGLKEYYSSRRNQAGSPESFSFKFTDRENNVKNLSILLSPISDSDEVLITVLNVNS